MITASVSETRRRLSELIELARRGEEVVIIKDSKPVAAISAVDSEDLELATKITDRQARRLHQMIEADSKVTFDSAKAAAEFLRRDARKETKKRR